LLHGGILIHDWVLRLLHHWLHHWLMLLVVIRIVVFVHLLLLTIHLVVLINVNSLASVWVLHPLTVLILVVRHLLFNNDNSV